VLQVFVSGKAGDKFAVQNYLGHAVVEDTGDNCCEYMIGVV
jgi:glutamate synthase domain-containing protein 3